MRIVLWLLGIPLGLMLLLYLVLLVTPIPLPFLAGPVQSAVISAMPPGTRIELGGMSLALEGGTWPVLKFSPVVFTEENSGARITMEALEVGFSPIRAMVGQPGASVTVVKPHIQIQQDLFGPRLVSFDIVQDPAGGPATVRILEGADAFPKVDFSTEGIDLEGEVPAGPGQLMRSDNDWLVYNLEGAGAGIAEIIAQAQAGTFSRLVVRDATLDMNDALYGVLRTFTDINLNIAPSADGLVAEGLFSANFGGTVMQGTLERVDDGNGTANLKASLNNFDLAAFVPMINDPDSMGGLVGGAAVSMDLAYDSATNKLKGGTFHVDLTGTEVRLGDDLFPLATSIMEMTWKPDIGEFTMGDTMMQIGQSTATMSGVFVMGLDPKYGPTISMATNARDVSIQPYDMAAPDAPFTEISFSGWTAPLYGAMGIDHFVAKRADGAELATQGRFDLLRSGPGFKMDIAAKGLTADDLKRLWPYLLAGDARDWMVKNLIAGVIENTTMSFNFPPGSLPTDGTMPTLGADAMSLQMSASGVVIKPSESMAPIALDGALRLMVDGTTITVAADGGEVATGGGPIGVSDAAVVIDIADLAAPLVEISGSIDAGIPAMLALVNEQQPDALSSIEMPVDLNALEGDVNLSVVATIRTDATNADPQIDYAVNGTLTDFASSAKIQDRMIGDGQLSFVASQEGYRVSGTASIDGMAAELLISGTPETAPSIVLGSTIDVAQLKEFGFDASEFLAGRVGFSAEPKADGSLGIRIDLGDAELTVAALGISKARGTPGALEATVKQGETVTEISDIALAFGDVSLKGGLKFDTEQGKLVSAELTEIALSEGDSARATITPIDGGGFNVVVRGDQLDLKPVLKRSFSVSEGAGGLQAADLNQTLALDVELKRVLGMYATTAYNLDLNLVINGSDIRRASLQAGLGDNRAISITTNDAPGGKVMTVAFNDMGSLLRLMGVYPNLVGGEGSLVLQTVNDLKVEVGRFLLNNFAIVDEAKLAELVEKSPGSISLDGNSMRFDSAQVDFTKNEEVIEVTEAMLAGDQLGGTMRGYVYTKQKQYDLVGTFVPLFELNSAFQKIPILGPLLGGREGEGMFGVTFAVRGALDAPEFKFNPASALAMGAFRKLFEFQTQTAD